MRVNDELLWKHAKYGENVFGRGVDLVNVGHGAYSQDYSQYANLGFITKKNPNQAKKETQQTLIFNVASDFCLCMRRMLDKC